MNPEWDAGILRDENIEFSRAALMAADAGALRDRARTLSAGRRDAPRRHPRSRRAPPEVIKAFDEAADTYDDWYRRPQGAQVLQAELRGLKALLPSSGLGAEAGAGTGVFAERLTSEGGRVVCIDPSPGMLKHAAGRGLPAILATVEACPLRDGCLSFAYIVTVLEFLPDPVRALRSLGAALRAEAPLVTLTINRESPWGALYAEMAERGDHIFGHARLYSFEEVRAFLARAGFEPREAVGALASAPGHPVEEIKPIPVGPGAGVILIKAVKGMHAATGHADRRRGSRRGRRSRALAGLERDN